MPESLQNPNFILLNGTAIVQTTKSLIKDRDVFKETPYLANGNVQITTNPIIKRIEHTKEHKKIHLKSNF